jgi:steroid delta-isomerase
MDQTAATPAIPVEPALAATVEPELRARLAGLACWYASLTPQSLGAIDDFYAPSARFKDPFNTVNSRDGIRRIFAHMFSKLQQPQFLIHEQLLDGRQAFLTWDFGFYLHGKHYVLHGGSHLHYDEHGMVIDHRDYWDSAEELLHKLPLIGAPLRWLRRQLSVQDDDRGSAPE